MNEKTKTEETLLGDPVTMPQESIGQPLLLHWQQWIIGFIVLAILTRGVRYILCFPLWEDECFLSVNFFHRDFRQLLQPLEYRQVAPVLFLWLQKTATILFGFNELALRLPSFLCSLASLALFVHLARRLLAGSALVLSIALFAVSYPNLRYATEAKQYGVDLLASLVLITLLVEWLRRPQEVKWLKGLVLWSPLAVGLSLPAMFTTATVSILLLGIMFRYPGTRRYGWWLVYTLTVLVSVMLLYWLIRPMMQREFDFLTEAWFSSFVPFNSVIALLYWLVTTHTGNLFAHPMGGGNFGSSLTTLILIVGVTFLIRRKRWVAALLLLLPLGIHLTAAALRLYPYGGHVKFSMYIAPMIYLVMGLGVAALVGGISRKKPPTQVARTLSVILIFIGCIGAGSIIRDVLYPYKTTADLRQRALATWLWHDGNFEDRVVCIKDDLGVSFSGRTWAELSWSAMYLGNKYIQSSKRIVREPRPEYVLDPSQRFLRCVLYRDPEKQDFQQEAFSRWLDGMKQKYNYVDMDRYALPREDRRNRRLVTIDYLEIYKFILPKDFQELNQGSNPAYKGRKRGEE
jgi:4-amino-4-deoxy-L-arabinose transferase-like glycosyltransferase